MKLNERINQYLIDHCYSKKMIASRMNLTTSQFENVLSGTLFTEFLIDLSSIVGVSIDTMARYESNNRSCYN